MRGFHIKWAAFSLCIYAAGAVWQGYMSLFYRSIGFSHVQIGFIGAATALCALAVQPAWGMLGDRMRKNRRLLAALAVFSAALLPAALIHSGFGPQILSAALFYSFYCALLPMGDSVLLSRLKQDGLPFGPYRLCGALGFAASGALFGWILGKSAPASVIWYTSVVLLMTAGAALLLPENPRKDRKKLAFRELFKNRSLMLLLGFMIPVQMTMGCFHSFFPTHFAALKGASEGLLGVGYALATAAEVPYLLLSDRIFRRFGAAIPMCVSAAILALRWLILGLGANAGVALAAQLLHGGGFIVMSVSMAKYIAQNVSENLQASGQMLLSMAAFGAARVAGNLGGGFLADRLGSGTMFFVCAVVCLVALGVFVPKVLRKS